MGSGSKTSPNAKIEITCDNATIQRDITLRFVPAAECGDRCERNLHTFNAEGCPWESYFVFRED